MLSAHDVAIVTGFYVAEGVGAHKLNTRSAALQQSEVRQGREEVAVSRPVYNTSVKKMTTNENIALKTKINCSISEKY